jgi:hypothetical protein
MAVRVLHLQSMAQLQHTLVVEEDAVCLLALLLALAV